MTDRILHVIGQLVRGGAERQLLYVVAALRDQGWAQTVVTLNPGQAWDARIEELGVPLVGIRRTWNRASRLLRLNDAVGVHHPAIVHSWSHHTNVYTRWIWRRPRPWRVVSFRNDPMVETVTGNPLARFPHPRAYETADAVISNSRSALAVAASCGVRIKRGRVVSNVVIARGRAVPDATTDGVVRLAGAGGLVPLKAFDVLVAAVAALVRQRMAVELYLAGMGPERERLEGLAQDLGLRGRVRFLGSVESVPDLFARCHVAVHPSRSEGLSNTILEAMAEGLPVVATPVGATTEYVEDGVTGMLVPPGNAEALTARLARLVESPSLRARLGEAAFNCVRDRCAPKVVLAQYEAVYHEVLEN